MTDWTGERFVLGAGGAQIHHEHLHRYSLASDLVEGRVVLDLGCGTGVGTAMLASRGASVTGVDIDAQTVACAAEQYGPGIAFIEGSAYAIPLPDSSVDVVVCFEVIEHVEEPARVLGEIARVLRDEGLLLISTPMKAEYNKGLIKPNPFHLNEMEHEDFVALVGAELPNTRVIRQRSMIVSGMWTDEVAEIDLMGSARALRDISPVYEVLIATRIGVLPKVGSSLYMEGVAQLDGEPETVGQVRVAQIQLAEWQALVDEVVEHRNNIQARVVYLEALLAEK
jgi:SAM-dependent methyltransferase